MNINTNGIINKLKQNADWAAFLFSGYQRMNSDVGLLMTHFTSGDAVKEATRSLTDLKLLKWKLWDCDHAYTGIFKMSLIARLLIEAGIVPPKWKKTTEKLMWGSGIAAVVLPGSSPPSSSSNRSGGGRYASDTQFARSG